MEQKHSQALCKQLFAFHGEMKYCDFKIVPEDGDPIPCHKVIMAAMSPFFDVMLNIDMEETMQGSVHLPVDKETVLLLLQYIYTGQNVITKDTVASIYDAANFLQIATLIEDCEIFLKREITEDICLEIWVVSKKFKSMEVAQISRSMVLQGFASFCTYDHMSITPLDDLTELLTDPYLNCTGTSKCKAAWMWLVAHQTAADKDVEKLVEALVNAENVVNADILKAFNLDEVDTTLEVDIDKLQTTWGRVCKKLWISADSVPLQTTGPNYDKDECFVMFVSDKSGKNRLLSLDFKKKKWYDLEVSERNLGHRFAICSRDSLLYFSGGTDCPTAFIMYNGAVKQWDNLEKMPVGREQHVMHNLNTKIYVLGGTSKTGISSKLWDVHMFNCLSDSWAKCGQVACPVIAACSAQIGCNIFLLGGSDAVDGRAPSDTLQCYDTETNFSSLIQMGLPFKAKSHSMSVTSFNDGIYIVHNAEVYYLVPYTRKPREELRKNLPGIQRVGPQLDKISTIGIEKPPLKGFAVTNFGNKILVIGGEDKAFATKKSIIQFDTELKQSVLLTVSAPFPVKDMHFTKLLVPRSWDKTDME